MPNCTKTLFVYTSELKHLTLLLYTWLVSVGTLGGDVGNDKCAPAHPQISS